MWLLPWQFCLLWVFVVVSTRNVERERMKQGFVQMAKGGGGDPFLSNCSLSRCLKFRNRSSEEGRGLRSDVFTHAITHSRSYRVINPADKKKTTYWLNLIFLQVPPTVDEASPSSTSSFEMIDMESGPAPYQEVQPHWFFCRRADDNASWLPFSRKDSDKLENASHAGKQVYILCCV